MWLPITTTPTTPCTPNRNTQMTPDSYTIRTMTADQLALAIDWAAAEGWNPGLEDAACFRAGDPDGFLVGLIGDRPVASISVVAYGESFGFLGFYIVHPDFRGQGLGRRLWQAGMARLGARTVGLDGVVAQQGNYAKSGFVLAHRNLRYGGTVAVGDPPGGLAPIQAQDIDRIVAYDRGCFSAARDAFLRCWLDPVRRTALWAPGPQGDVTGYGVLRRCRDGHKIGPLFADTPEIAERLFLGLAAHAAGGPVYLDPPQPNVAAVAMAERFGLAPVFETARTYKGPAPDLPLDRIFGIATFELG